MSKYTIRFIPSGLADFPKSLEVECADWDQDSTGKFLEFTDEDEAVILSVRAETIHYIQLIPEKED